MPATQVPTSGEDIGALRSGSAAFACRLSPVRASYRANSISGSSIYFDPEPSDSASITSCRLQVASLLFSLIPIHLPLPPPPRNRPRPAAPAAGGRRDADLRTLGDPGAMAAHPPPRPRRPAAEPERGKRQRSNANGTPSVLRTSELSFWVWGAITRRARGRIRTSAEFRACGSPSIPGSPPPPAVTSIRSPPGSPCRRRADSEDHAPRGGKRGSCCHDEHDPPIFERSRRPPPSRPYCVADEHQRRLDPLFATVGAQPQPPVMEVPHCAQARDRDRQPLRPAEPALLRLPVDHHPRVEPDGGIVDERPAVDLGDVDGALGAASDQRRGLLQAGRDAEVASEMVESSERQDGQAGAGAGELAGRGADASVAAADDQQRIAALDRGARLLGDRGSFDQLDVAGDARAGERRPNFGDRLVVRGDGAAAPVDRTVARTAVGSG